MIAKPTSDAALQVTVTDTATTLLSLLNTANGSTLTLDDSVRYIVKIYCDDGAVRYSSCGTPTSAIGQVIPTQTPTELKGIVLSEIKFIRVSGDVKMNVELGVAHTSPNL